MKQIYRSRQKIDTCVGDILFSLLSPNQTPQKGNMVVRGRILFRYTKPFYQLCIIHAFVKHDELEKQVSEFWFIDLTLKLNTYIHIYIF